MLKNQPQRGFADRSPSLENENKKYNCKVTESDSDKIANVIQHYFVYTAGCPSKGLARKGHARLFPGWTKKSKFIEVKNGK